MLAFEENKDFGECEDEETDLVEEDLVQEVSAMVEEEGGRSRT